MYATVRTGFGLGKRSAVPLLVPAGRRLSYVLGIETSCDDTGLAIVDTSGRVLANVLESQQEFHTR